MKILKLIKIVFLFLLATLVFSMPVLSASADSQARSWYVRRNGEHKQPTADVNGDLLSELRAYYVDPAHREQSEDKVLYLTFDAGYENGNIAKIMDTLQAEEVPAAFFVLKNMITKEGDLLRRMVNEGHLVCNHTMSHRDMTRLSPDDFRAELNGLAALYREQLGADMPKYYRPPEGRYTYENLRTAAEMGYATIFWSFAYADWDNDKQPSKEAAMKKILDNTHNGAVILLHPTSATNAEIMPALIQEWKAQGYRFGTLDELTGAGG